MVIIPSAAFFGMAAFGLGVSSVVMLIMKDSDPAGVMIAAFSSGMEGIVVGLAAWFVFQKSIGREQADLPVRLPFASWQIVMALGLMFGALILGGVIALIEIDWISTFVLPFLTILVIVPPIWIMLGLGANGLVLGSRWRTWGIISLGMTLGPLVMLMFEILLAILVAVMIAITFTAQTEIANDFIRVAGLINQQTDPEMILEFLAPYVLDPRVVATVLGYIALAVPLIEELLKPLGIWIFAGEIKSPAEGFALGLLSGAAYAFMESLGASGRGGPDWPMVVGVRAGTSLLHITTTGLMGWAIVSAWRERRIARLFGTYLLVVLVHGIWNGSAVGIGMAVLAEMVGQPGWITSLLPAAICGMSVLGFGMLLLLIASNRRLRLIPAPSLPEPMQEVDAGGVKLSK
jgi:hypothetical protein